MKRISMRLNVQLWVNLAAVACLAAMPAKTPAKAAAADPAPEGPTRLLRYADISKDKVVFAYAGDLWISSREGGAARRLTSHTGDEVFPKFSPDGKWLTFTSNESGRPEVYVQAFESTGAPRVTGERHLVTRSGAQTDESARHADPPQAGSVGDAAAGGRRAAAAAGRDTRCWNTAGQCLFETRVAKFL
jgi:dipeptidyl aminopeptidase/acylaminoacyl peptidase